MARVSGPLMSVAARGSFADILTYREMATRGGETSVSMRRIKTPPMQGALTPQLRDRQNVFRFMRAISKLLTRRSRLYFLDVENNFPVFIPDLLQQTYGNNYVSKFWRTANHREIFTWLINSHIFVNALLEQRGNIIADWENGIYEFRPARFNRNYVLDSFGYMLDIEGIAAAATLANIITLDLKIAMGIPWTIAPNSQVYYIPNALFFDPPPSGTVQWQE